MEGELPTDGGTTPQIALDADAFDGIELGQSARVHLAPAIPDAGLQVPLTAIQPGADGGKAVWIVDRATNTVALRNIDYDAAEPVPLRDYLAGRGRGARNQ